MIRDGVWFYFPKVYVIHVTSFSSISSYSNSEIDLKNIFRIEDPEPYPHSNGEQNRHARGPAQHPVHYIHCESMWIDWKQLKGEGGGVLFQMLLYKISVFWQIKQIHTAIKRHSLFKKQFSLTFCMVNT